MAAPLLIADVPWLLYRSFFALPKSITDSQGRPVNALLGTVNAILAVLEARPARALAACMGAEEADYRVRLYPAYHAHRDPMPAELATQWALAPHLLEALDWNFTASEELEADDVMFSYALAEQRAGGEALLLSGDRDMYAAVTDHVAVAELGKGGKVSELGPADVRARYGVDPEQVADFIALRGDPSDGLPGAPGIGAKTAAELLREHGSLEAVLAAAGAVEGPGDGAFSQAAAAAVRATRAMKPRTAASLRENAELLRAFKEIATLQRVKVRRPPDRPTNFAAGAVAARELGMNRLSERLERLAG